MFRSVAILLMISLGLVSLGCEKKHTPAMVVVDGEKEIRWVGDVPLVEVGAGNGPDIWRPGNIVVFRVDRVLGGQNGQAGKAYRIKDDKKLEPLEAVDLSQSDDQLAARYGIVNP